MILRPGSPDEVGVSTTAVARIRERCAGWVKQGVHPSLVVLAARRSVIFLHEAYGKLTPEDNAPALPLDAIFPLTSLVKPITTSCAMILVEDGFLGLNRPVQAYIPEFSGEGKERVMVHQLFTHTSGITDAYIGEVLESDEARTMDGAERDETLHPAVHRILQLGYKTPLVHPPGELMEYSELGIYFIAEIVRRLSGMSLNAFAKERLFDPLGMVDTSYGLPEAKRNRYCYRPEDGPEVHTNEPEFLDRPSPSSGGFSTAMDMAVFGQMFLNRGRYGNVRIFSPVTIEAMTHNQIPGIGAKYFDETFPEAGWSLVWSINQPIKGEVCGEQLLSPNSYGHGDSSGVVLWVDPARELLMVFFSVITQSLDDRPMLGADLFMNMIAAAVED